MMMHVRRAVLVALVAVAASARPASAQESALAPAAEPAAEARAASAPAGPTLESSRVAARPMVQSATTTTPNAAAAANMGRPVALMLVGFGALLAGAIIGDDVGTIFMVGGALIGLVGLYEYLR